jgi:hypothetical protein
VSTKTCHIGVVGYTTKKFNKTAARKNISEAFTVIPFLRNLPKFVVVSKLVNVGIPKLAYEEAVERGWSTVGIAPAKAEQYVCFPVNEWIIVGDNWGDESETFLDRIDVLVRVGDDKQSTAEAAEAWRRGKHVIEHPLPAIG